MNPLAKSSWEIDFRNDQQCLDVDTELLRNALLIGLQAEQVASAVLSICLVDNDAIHRMNREHLQHDYPTDVISFQLDFAADPESEDRLDDQLADADGLRARGAAIEGEIIASVEMAAEMASDGDWSPLSELTLYVIHGFLHICGYDDVNSHEQSLMRQREQQILGLLGLSVVYAEETTVCRIRSDVSDSGTSGATA